MGCQSSLNQYNKAANIALNFFKPFKIISCLKYFGRSINRRKNGITILFVNIFPRYFVVISSSMHCVIVEKMIILCQLDYEYQTFFQNQKRTARRAEKQMSINSHHQPK